MNALVKTASACASVYLKKKANIYTEGTERLAAGADELVRGKAWLKAMRGKESVPTWMKALLGLGGAKLVLDRTQDNTQRGWRD